MTEPLLTLCGLSFTYPEQAEPALRELSLTVEEGAFLVLCGPSGCGKSTLLRQLKPVMAPHGLREGEILFRGRPLSELDGREQASRIGFVQQDPDNQLVTDKVWHELAFGLESLGLDTPTIRRRVSEMASFFGIQTWFYKKVSELSGGQKQLLNLAAVMVMQPELLILDEPTSQLDPIAASDFLATLGKLNRELGTAILLTEHRLEEAFPLASRVAVLDGGRLVCTGSPAEVGRELKGRGHGMFLAMPTPMRVWAAVESEAACPVTVNEGREWLRGFAETRPLDALPPEKLPVPGEEVAVRAEELWFKYDKDGPDVVKGLDLELRRGELLALLGGNGTGKTTAVRLLAGLRKPYRGELKLNARAAVLPQDPQTLFVKKTLREDLEEALRGRELSGEERAARLGRVIRLCRLEALLDRHPYDLSGGERQRAALAKVLLPEPELLLMDEPTKGLDAEFKQSFAAILRELTARGVAILMVSHDVEFCARYAHRCALFFDGSIAAEDTPRRFFSGNSFYTTAANRMGRALLPEAVTAEDLIAACGGALPAEAPLPEAEDFALPEKDDEAASLKKLPLWRKLLAGVSLLGAVWAFIAALRTTDLSALVTQGGMTLLAGDKLRLAVILIASLFVFAFAVGRRSKKPVTPRLEKQKQRLSRRTLVAAAMILLLIPLTLFVGFHWFSGEKYYFFSLLILLECMAPFFMVFEGRRPQARELVVLAVLCALGVAGRAAFFMLPQFKPVLALTIIAGVAFGGESGFLVGSLTMLVSNIMFSQGVWMPWQMFTMGVAGFLAGVLFRKGLLRRSRLSLCIFGAIVALVVYGGVMNFAAALMEGGTISPEGLLPFYVVGLPIDCVHAAATVLILWFAAEPMLEKLDRIKVKYGLVE